METILTFISELKNNNTREWFSANKSWYEEVKLKFESIVTEVIHGLSAFDKDMQFLTPRDCVFRIYRDIRFSKNKEPYKTHLGASFNKGGRNSKYSGYYLHLEPGAAFIGGGKWQPSPDLLKAIRYEIYQFPEEFEQILNAKPFFSRFGSLSNEKLLRPPKDFPADFKYVELLKYKSYIVGYNVPDHQLLEKDFLSKVVETCKIMHPLIEYLNRAIDH
jgi:uncharacterized protein (TIGR02453 family)